AAARIGGWQREEAAAAAWLALLVSSSGPAGNTFGSYLFDGNGLFTQALAMPFFVLTLALGFRLCAGERPASPVMLGVGMALTFAFQRLYGYLAALVLIAVGVPSFAIRGDRRRLLRDALLAMAVFGALSAYQLLSIWQDTPLMRRSEFGPDSR